MWTGAYTVPITTGVPVVTTNALAPATVGVAYSWQLAAIGTNGPIKWTLAAGNLPTGMQLTAAGLLSGTPTAAGTSTLTFQVLDSLNQVATSGPLSLLVNASTGTAPSPAQAMFPGQTRSKSVGFAWWPAADGTLPDTWNVYRQDISSTVPHAQNIPGSGTAPAPTVPEYSVKQFAYAEGQLTAGTAYTYWVTPVKGGIEGPPSAQVTLTTLAAGPGSTPPTAAVPPENYLPPPPTLAQLIAGVVWTCTVLNDTTAAGVPGVNNTGQNPGLINTGKLSVGCSYLYAAANSSPGDTIVLTAGQTYTSLIGQPSAFVGPTVLGPQWTYIISSEDPVFKAGGALPGFLPYTPTNRYTPFTLAALPAAGALSATLAAPWAGRNAYLPTKFYTAAVPRYETRMCHYVNGSSTINWNAGFNPTGLALLSSLVGGSGYVAGQYVGVALTGGTGTGATALITVTGTSVSAVFKQAAGSGYSVGDVLSATFSTGTGFSVTVKSVGGGPLVGNVTSATILTEIGNWVTPDDLPAMPKLQFSFTQNSGLGITFQNGISKFVRMIGIAVVPAPSQTPNHTCVAAVTINTTDILLDRCVIGNDTTLPTWSPCTRGVAANGVHNSGHQCFIYGFHYGVPHTSSNTTGDGQGWNWQGQIGVLQNSFVEAVVENVWMGGGGFNAQNFIPGDLVARGNYSYKNGAWVGTEFGRFIKNHHEQKMGQHCEAHDNIYESCWWSQGSSGQNGRVFNVGSIDQVASVSPRKIQSISSNANGLVTGSALFYGLAQGTKFTTTVSGVTNAAYNGTFLCTMTGTDLATFQYQLPSNPGPPGAATGFLAIVAQCCQPWVVVSDFNCYNNQAYGVATFADPHQDEGQQVNGKNMRHRYANNLMWINPGGTDDVAPSTLGFGQAFNGSNVTDVIIDHNTEIIIPSQTGYLLTGPSQFTSGMTLFSASAPGADRWTVTNNILDGHFAFQVNATQAGNPQGTGPSAFGLMFINPLWSNNVTILDASAYPNPPAAGGQATYAQLFGPGFSNTVMPVTPDQWNVDQAPFTTASTIGDPIGATFLGSNVPAADAYPRTYLNMVGGSPGLLASGNTSAGVPFATVAAQSHFVSMGVALGYESGVGTTVQALVSGWKTAAAGNGITLRAVTYIPGGSAYYPQSGAPGQNFWLAHALAAGNMWLYNNAAGSGVTNLQTYAGFATAEAFPLFTPNNIQTVPSFTYNGKTGVNVGLNVWNVQAQYYWDVFSQGLAVSKYGDAAQAACPALDGLFVDNMMSVAAPHFFSTTSSCWNGQGTTPITNASVSPATLQQGEANLVQAFQAQNPNILIVANCDFPNQLPAIDPSYRGLWSALFSEGVIENLEAFGATTFMSSLISAEALLASGGTIIFHQDTSPGGVNNLAGPQSGWTATQWRSVRFGFAAAMMRNWHYALNCGQGAYSAVGLLDEQVQGGNYGWLSNGTQRLDPPQSAPFANGVWRRRFPNGWVLWNPRTNGTQVVTIPSTLARLTTRGYGDPNVNNQATGATTVTLQDADGLFLIGTG